MSWCLAMHICLTYHISNQLVPGHAYKFRMSHKLTYQISNKLVPGHAYMFDCVEYINFLVYLYLLQ